MPPFCLAFCLCLSFPTPQRDPNGASSPKSKATASEDGGFLPQGSGLQMDANKPLEPILLGAATSSSQKQSFIEGASDELYQTDGGAAVSAPVALTSSMSFHVEEPTLLNKSELSSLDRHFRTTRDGTAAWKRRTWEVSEPLADVQGRHREGAPRNSKPLLTDEVSVQLTSDAGGLPEVELAEVGISEAKTENSGACLNGCLSAQLATETATQNQNISTENEILIADWNNPTSQKVSHAEMSAQEDPPATVVSTTSFDATAFMEAAVKRSQDGVVKLHLLTLRDPSSVGILSEEADGAENGWREAMHLSLSRRQLQQQSCSVFADVLPQHPGELVATLKSNMDRGYQHLTPLALGPASEDEWALQALADSAIIYALSAGNFMSPFKPWRAMTLEEIWRSISLPPANEQAVFIVALDVLKGALQSMLNPKMWSRREATNANSVDDGEGPGVLLSVYRGAEAFDVFLTNPSRTSHSARLVGAVLVKEVLDEVDLSSQSEEPPQTEAHPQNDSPTRKALAREASESPELQTALRFMRRWTQNGETVRREVSQSEALSSQPQANSAAFLQPRVPSDPIATRLLPSEIEEGAWLLRQATPSQLQWLKAVVALQEPQRRFSAKEILRVLKRADEVEAHIARDESLQKKVHALLLAVLQVDARDKQFRVPLYGELIVRDSSGAVRFGPAAVMCPYTSVPMRLLCKDSAETRTASTQTELESHNEALVRRLTAEKESSAELMEPLMFELHLRSGRDGAMVARSNFQPLVLRQFGFLRISSANRFAPKPSSPQNLAKAKDPAPEVPRSPLERAGKVFGARLPRNAEGAVDPECLVSRCFVSFKEPPQ